MSKSPTLLSLYFLSNLVLVLNNVFVNSNGLKIRLIHPHSSLSPFFQGDLSHEKRVRMQATQSNIRANYLPKTTSSTMQTSLDAQNFQYIVKIGIGTFKSEPPYKEYYLEMDTGSSLVWIQCEGCTKCFKQITKPFPKQNSSSFRPLLVNNKPTYYETEYADGASTKGMLAHERFYLKSNEGKSTKVENIKFGCGLQNDMQYGRYKYNKIAGIMGLGWEEFSFLKQLGPQFKGMFSYCLPAVSSKTPNTYLRFGDDTIRTKISKSTPLFRMNGTSPYYVKLLGISVNNSRLKIKPEVFAYNNNAHSGGCIIDSGTPYSRIVSPAYDALKLELEKYFSKFKDLKKIKGSLGLEICYERSKPMRYNTLPDITFHLSGLQADFVMKAAAVFEVFGRSILLRNREYFCLAMLRDDKRSIIGTYQQKNHKIIYDTKSKKLIFYPEDCSKNP